MGFAEWRQGDTIRFLELLNAAHTRNIENLEKQLSDSKELNTQLLLKLGILEQQRQVITQDFTPIGGFRPARDRIKEAEAADREEFSKLREQELRNAG